VTFIIDRHVGEKIAARKLDKASNPCLIAQADAIRVVAVLGAITGTSSRKKRKSKTTPETKRAKVGDSPHDDLTEEEMESSQGSTSTTSSASSASDRTTKKNSPRSRWCSFLREILYDCFHPRTPSQTGGVWLCF